MAPPSSLVDLDRIASRPCCVHARATTARPHQPSPPPSSVRSTTSPTPTPSAIPWIAAPVPKEAPTPSERGIRKCLASDLAGSFLTSEAAAGNDLNVIGVRNISRTDCYVKGRPHVRLLTTGGSPSLWSSGTTFFPDEGVIEILLTPKTPTPKVDSEIKPGQATLGFSYFDCDPRDRFDRVVVEFGGHRFVAMVDPSLIGATGLPACNGGTRRTGPVQPSANNFEPPPTPPSPLQDLRIEMTAPGQATARSRLHFGITLVNTGHTTLRFRAHCPGYAETLGNSRASVTSSYQLNCTGVVIPAGNFAIFEVSLDVPKNLVGHMNLEWRLLPKRTDLPDTSTPILVTSA